VLYESYKDKVYSIALYHFHGDAAIAADVTQQVFVKAITNIGNFRGDAGIGTWLYRLTANECVDRRRAGAAREIATSPETFAQFADTRSRNWMKAPPRSHHEYAQQSLRCPRSCGFLS